MIFLHSNGQRNGIALLYHTFAENDFLILEIYQNNQAIHMMNEENLEKINEVINHYFDTNASVDWIPAKAIMPALIEAGIFTKDEKKGLPIRKILRKLDKESTLEKIPAVHVERRSENMYWYFVREGEKYTPKEKISAISKKEQNKINIQSSDEYYLVNLCDELLNEKASRKHTFDSIVGNLHKRGKGRTKLPLDAYYKDLKLVIEFFEKRKEEENLDEVAQARLEQIKYYDALKKEAVIKKELQYIAINYASFECDDKGKLARNKDNDTVILESLLKDFLTSK